MAGMKDLLTAAQAAAELGIHRNNVLKAMRKGTLKAKQYGKVWLATRAAVAEYGKKRAPEERTGVDNATQ